MLNPLGTAAQIWRAYRTICVHPDTYIATIWRKRETGITMIWHIIYL